MTDVLPLVERQGINPRFKKINAFLKLDFPGADTIWESWNLVQLERFRAEGEGFTYLVGESPYHYRIGSLPGDLFNVSLGLRVRAFKAALNGQADWERDWHRSVAYGYWRQRIEQRYEQHRLALYRDQQIRQHIPTMSLDQLAATMGDCLLLGWKTEALDLVRRVLSASNDYFFLDQGSDYHRRAQFFAWRVIILYQGWPDQDNPGVKFLHDEPVFNALLSQWDAPDPDALAPLLLAALDRHTFESVNPTASKEADFKDPSYWYHPYEVLVLLKARQMKGLENPVLDHPLAQTPLGQLPAEVPLYSDELLEGIVAQVRTVYPDL
jgi:hypothetical protein